MTVLDAIKAGPATAPDVLDALNAAGHDRDEIMPLVMEDVREILQWHVRDGRAEMAGVRAGETLYVARGSA